MGGVQNWPQAKERLGPLRGLMVPGSAARQGTHRGMGVQGTGVVGCLSRLPGLLRGGSRGRQLSLCGQIGAGG